MVGQNLGYVRTVNTARLLMRAAQPAIRATWARTLSALLPGPRTAVPPEWGSRPYRVLFVRYERIGDMIMATGLIRAIATAHSTISVDVVASARNAAVLANNPHVTRVFALDRTRPGAFLRTLRAVRRVGYDAVVDGRINNPRVFFSTPLLMLASRARFRIGTSDPTGNHFYNVRVPGGYSDHGETHYIDASALLLQPFGVDPHTGDFRPEIFLTAAERATAEQRWKDDGAASDNRLLVNVSAPELPRRWPDDRFVEVILAARDADAGLKVGIMGTPGDHESVRAIARVTGSTAIETRSVREAFAAVATADLLFTPDTSISHAASAFQKPAVVMLRRDLQSYVPYRLPGIVLLWDGETIATLPTAAVRNAVQTLVREQLHSPLTR
jgi:ADP-heptose:LPS heptosyltransferase